MSVAACRKLRLAYLLAAYGLLVPLMLHILLTGRDSLIGNGFALAWTVSVTMACAYDAASLGRPWTLGTRFPFWLCLPVTLPLYVVRAHGWWGVLFLFLHFALLFVAAFIWAFIAVARGMPLPQ